ncbi:hypothetical protein [uncultured Clostridium sp.]|uniref:hypothetical protein n=1 Tax=uncultured Clostridium sp. TaxID=59620 RepID=UPI0028ECBACE|nr:hypothetical protein [uncultured Clostridium sp.]
MPLHTIPLCSFSYVGDALSGATLKYDTRNKVEKEKLKLAYRKNHFEIEKSDSQLLYKNSINNFEGFIGEKLLYEDSINFYKNTEIKNIEKEDKNIDLNTCKEVNKEYKSIELAKYKDLNREEVNVNKNLSLDLAKQNRDFYKTNDIQLKTISKDKNIIISSNKELDRNKNMVGINKHSNLSFDIDNILNLNIADASIYLNRQIEQGIYINTLLELERLNLEKEIIKENVAYVDRWNSKNLDIIEDKILDRLKVRNLHVANGLLYLFKFQEYSIFNLNTIYAERIDIKGIDNYSTILTYKDSIKDIHKMEQFNLLYKHLLKDMYKAKNGQLLYKDYKKSIFKDSVEFLHKDIIKRLLRPEAAYLNKINFMSIFKSVANYLEYSKEKTIFKNIEKELKDAEVTDISKEKLYSLLKYKTDIYRPSNIIGLDEGFIDISKNIYSTTDLEVIKRWWILGATKPTDLKMLPFDYGYRNNPLQVNRRDREYGWSIEQDKHPISYMPYLEDLQGIDLNYGLDEMNLSIEIMLDMVNIVGMVVQHSASQFANASGQEAIEFIMEVLLDWLNVDTTIQEMQSKGSRGHYLRTYRWIRWEAEKVWFMADKDHSIDRMKGIKYAVMLFSNLLDYMKYHHFNIVPLWRNLKAMDIERQFNRQAVNGDIMKDLDKNKGKRHYLLETQNFKRKNFLGGN